MIILKSITCSQVLLNKFLHYVNRINFLYKCFINGVNVNTCSKVTTWQRGNQFCSIAAPPELCTVVMFMFLSLHVCIFDTMSSLFLVNGEREILMLTFSSELQARKHGLRFTIHDLTDDFPWWQWLLCE